MDNKLILIGALIIIIIIIIVITILKSNKSESFVEPRGLVGKFLRTNMLSNAYAGGQKYTTNSIDPSELKSNVSKAAMANAGSIDVLAQYFNAQKVKPQDIDSSNTSESNNEPIIENSGSGGLILTQNNMKIPKNNVDNSVESSINPEIDSSDNYENEGTKEGFFSTGLESAKVNAMGTVEGPKIFTNGQLAHGLTYDDIVKGVNEGKQVSDHCVAGAGKGDAFEEIYQDYVKIQDQHDMNPTGVRSEEEVAEITKSLNGNMNMAKHNLLTRAGAGKMKIKLDPNGTVGVMEDNARLLPERDRNHTIYATNHAIHIPGYEMPFQDMYQSVSNGGSGFGKAMSSEVSDVVTGIGSNAAKNSKILNNKTNESFSNTY